MIYIAMLLQKKRYLHISKSIKKIIIYCDLCIILTGIVHVMHTYRSKLYFFYSSNTVSELMILLADS